MEQGAKRTQRDYSLTFKLAVVDQIEKGELTYKQAQTRYGIQGRVAQAWSAGLEPGGVDSDRQARDGDHPKRADVRAKNQRA